VGDRSGYETSRSAGAEETAWSKGGFAESLSRSENHDTGIKKNEEGAREEQGEQRPLSERRKAFTKRESGSGGKKEGSGLCVSSRAGGQDKSRKSRPESPCYVTIYDKETRAGGVRGLRYNMNAVAKKN